jgi:hypothetical protein
MQLVLLCKEADCKPVTVHKVFERLIHDLKSLEDEGIEVGSSGPVKGTVVCVLGDNLGSHFIGGFTQNFSTSHYICRYCLATRSEFENTPLVCTASRRTKVMYDAAVQSLQQNTELVEYQAIKHNSPFNQLLHFHVCNPGLPPCLGHDLFEGVIDYDLALCIKYFVKTLKVTTIDLINQRIRKFPFEGSDAASRPCMLKADCKKLGGNAVQNWNMLRFITVLIGDKIDHTNDVWVLVLIMREMTEAICAPKLTESVVAFMKFKIEEYLELRVQCFSDRLRPKHHYLVHYAQLSLAFGPLIRLWTLRFESKHSYFKRCIRYSQNFLNVTLTMSVKHQLLQAYQSSGSLFPAEVVVNNSVVFHAEMYHVLIQKSVESFDFSHVNTVVCDRITVKGTLYQNGHHVFLPSAGDNDQLSVGCIKLVLIKNECIVFFIVLPRACKFVQNMGVYQVTDITSVNYLCVNVESLLDYYPLHVYKVKNSEWLALKHKFVF